MSVPTTFPAILLPFLDEIVETIQRMDQIIPLITEASQPLDIYVILSKTGDKVFAIQKRAEWMLYPSEVIRPFMEELSQTYDLPMDPILALREKVFQEEDGPERFISKVYGWAQPILCQRYRGEPDRAQRACGDLYAFIHRWKSVNFSSQMEISKAFDTHITSISDSVYHQLVKKIESIPNLSENIDGMSEVLDQFQERLLVLAEARIPMGTSSNDSRAPYLECIEEVLDEFKVETAMARRFIMEHMQKVPYQMFLMGRTLDSVGTLIDQIQEARYM